jgi:AcrR family transcriptional regulator
VASSTRPTRTERKAATRDRLLDAAARVFARRGFHGASVDAVAEEAGFSTGAVYSNFRGKEDLFLSLLERHAERQSREISESIRELPSVDARAQRAARQWIAFVDREPEFMMLFIEFWAYAVRDERLRPEFAERFAAVRGSIARVIADGARDLGVRLKLPAEQLATAVNALADGLALQRLADPEAVPDRLYGTVLSMLLTAASSEE